MKPIETVDKCTTCSTCVAYCPVTRATRAFKGPKLTGPSSERFRLFDETGGGEISEIEALDYCSNCKNCDIACPSGVKISTLNMLARAASPSRPCATGCSHMAGRWASWRAVFPTGWSASGPPTPSAASCSTSSAWTAARPCRFSRNGVSRNGWKPTTRASPPPSGAISRKRRSSFPAAS